MRSLRYPFFWFFAGMLLVGILLYFTLIPATDAPDLSINDKVAHGIAFVILMVWFCGVFESRWSPLVALALIGLGILIELMQQQVGYRSAEILDGVADVIGIALGWLLSAAGLSRWTGLLESLLPPRSS